MLFTDGEKAMKFTAFIAYDLTRRMDKLCVMHDVAPVVTKWKDTLGGCHDRQGRRIL